MLSVYMRVVSGPRRMTIGPRTHICEMSQNALNRELKRTTSRRRKTSGNTRGYFISSSTRVRLGECCVNLGIAVKTKFAYRVYLAPDLPEALTEGKEGLYIKSFYDRLVRQLVKFISESRTVLILLITAIDEQTRFPHTKRSGRIHRSVLQSREDEGGI